MANNSNTASTGISTSGFDMNDFDRLPKAAREALANANHNWNCSQAYKALRTRRYGKRFTQAEFIARVREHDAVLTSDYYVALSEGRVP